MTISNPIAIAPIPAIDLSPLEARLVALEVENAAQANAIAALQSQTSGLAPGEHTISTAELAAQGYQDFTFTPGKTFLLHTMSFTAISRVRLYRSAAYREADRTRAAGTKPSGEHGLILDLIPNSGNPLWDLSPLALGSNADSPRNSNCYGIIENKNGVALALSATFYYLTLED